MAFLDALEQNTTGFSSLVCFVWLTEWLIAFGFSLFARQMARRGEFEGEKRASFALLPAYESTIAFKKIGLVVMMVEDALYGTLPFGSDLQPVALLLTFVANWLYVFTYVTVIYVLCAKSAGTATLYRAIGTTLVLAFVVGAINFFEYKGFFNVRIVDNNSAHNTTFAEWPSFGGKGPSRLSTSVPGYGTEFSVSYFRGDLTVTYFWIGLAAAILGVLGMGLISVKLCPPPRQVGMVAVLYAMFMILLFATYLANWTSVINAFGFDPAQLFGVIEMPLKYYIMLLDSRVRHARP